MIDCWFAFLCNLLIFYKIRWICTDFMCNKYFILWEIIAFLFLPPPSFEVDLNCRCGFVFALTVDYKGSSFWPQSRDVTMLHWYMGPWQSLCHSPVNTPEPPLLAVKSHCFLPVDIEFFLPIHYLPQLPRMIFVQWRYWRIACLLSGAWWWWWSLQASLEPSKWPMTGFTNLPWLQHCVHP